MNLTTESLGTKRKVFWTVFMALRRGRGFKPAAGVGTGCNDSDWPGELVVSISQRLVLEHNRHRRYSLRHLASPWICTQTTRSNISLSVP